MKLNIALFRNEQPLEMFSLMFTKGDTLCSIDSFVNVCVYVCVTGIGVCVRLVLECELRLVLECVCDWYWSVCATGIGVCVRLVLECMCDWYWSVCVTGIGVCV